METYIFDWLNLIIRWAHIVVGIAWIGASFYFIWLDTKLNLPPRDPEDEGVKGDLWAVHGGGFYHAQKYKVVPGELPEPLHWFKWEAYATWITGFLLLIVLYYVNADIYLVDKTVADISGNMAIAISLGLIILGWLVYDLLCKSMGDNKLIALIGCLLVIILSWGLSQVFGGRGLYIQVGVMLGTIMTANVLMVIIPGQRELVRAKERGEEPDPAYGTRGKQRSVHNNYITLPVLFVMMSNHYPMTYGHQYNWLILIVLFIVGAVIRHYFNLRNEGRHVPAIPVLAVITMMMLAWIIMPEKPKKYLQDDEHSVSAVIESPSFSQVQTVLKQHCNTCHSASPSHPTAPIAPNGVKFDTVEEIQQWSERIYERSVITRTMPLANLTEMTEAERELLARWFNTGAKTN